MVSQNYSISKLYLQTGPKVYFNHDITTVYNAFSNTTVSNTSRCLEKLWLRPISQSETKLTFSLERKTLAETKVSKTAKQVQYLQYYSLVYRDFR
jgi:hypothetical protein